MNCYSIDGYGVDTTTLSKVTTESLIKFFEKYIPSDYAIMMGDLGGNPAMKECEDWMDKYNGDNSGSVGRYSIISSVMTESTGMTFEYHSYKEHHVIVFPTCLPWQLNEEEKKCTQKDLESIFARYFGELGVLSVFPTYIQASYCG